MGASAHGTVSITVQFELSSCMHCLFGTLPTVLHLAHGTVLPHWPLSSILLHLPVEANLLQVAHSVGIVTQTERSVIPASASFKVVASTNMTQPPTHRRFEILICHPFDNLSFHTSPAICDNIQQSQHFRIHLCRHRTEMRIAALSFPTSSPSNDDRTESTAPSCKSNVMTCRR